MVTKKPRIVIIGAGMAGLTAANKLYKSCVKKGGFELSVIEGGNRIGGRIKSCEFGGDRIEMGATWIHGIEGSPIYKIAQEIKSLESEQPWECMDGFLDDPITIAENGYVLNPSLVDPISNLFNNLMDFAQGKKSSKICGFDIEKKGKESVGSFLKKGLESYWNNDSVNDENDEEVVIGDNEWNKKSLKESIFAMHENIQRTYTSANDLYNLDYMAESEYVMFPGEEITIAKGYSSVIESLASALPLGCIQLGKKVISIEWQSYDEECVMGQMGSRPVKIHFLDGSSISADHVIVTVSLGVLKAGIKSSSDSQSDSMFKFSPPLPNYKIEAISRLGYGVVNKLFLKLSHDFDLERFPFLQMVFHKSDDHKARKNPKIPWWIRKTAFIQPIYEKSCVLLSWFAGEEAVELESLPDEVILDKVSATISSFLSPIQTETESDLLHSESALTLAAANAHYNKNGESLVKFEKVLKSGWANDPLFMGSYSYIAVGSSIADIDSLSEPLPSTHVSSTTTTTSSSSLPLQILFAGEATHRSHYSTTHGAYLSGLREANRLLQHYHWIGV